MRIELFIALRYLLRRRKAGFISLISLISVLGVAVGVMALIVVLSVMGGFDRELKSKIVGVNPHVIITAQGGVANYNDEIHALLGMNVPKLRSVSPFVVGQGIIKSAQNAVGVMVKGLDLGREEMGFLQKAMSEGTLTFDIPASMTITKDDEQVVGGVLIGRSLASQLGVNEGDIIELISPFVEKKGLLPPRARTEAFRVNGTFQVGMYDIDSTLAVISIERAQHLYNLGDTVTGIGIKLDDVYWAERVKKFLSQTYTYPIWVQTWIDMNRNFFDALQVEKHVMAILLFLIILVAAFNIVSTLIMVVMEKTKDIGIMKALGVTRGAIQRIFIMEGSIVGLIGTVCGVGAGLIVVTWLNPIADFIKNTTGFEVFPSNVYYFDRIPTQTDPMDVVLIAVFAFGISVIAGVYPALRAASLEPAETLRYE